MKVVVLGAGVVGVAAAWYLNKAGHEVVVIDRQPGAGLETSFANGGQIAVSHAEPWASPAALPKILEWLGREDAPLIVRWRLDPALFAWGLRFLRNCTPGRVKINVERTVRVALYSRKALIELRAETGIEYDQRTEGILSVYRTQKELDAAAKVAEETERLGCRRVVLDRAGCVALEPALETAAATLAGGIHSPDDESGDAHLFTARLAEMAVERGVRFEYGRSVLALLREGDRITGVSTDSGIVTADAYVMALGSYSPLLLRPLGIRLPVYPAKGYSVTLPVAGHNAAPTISLTDDSRKLVFSRLGDRLRIGGTAELAGYDTTLRPVRSQAVLKGALALFPNAGDPAQATFWCGLRPVTPDSVPVIGRTPYKNLYLDTGHGTLGWTMACGSGRIVADLVSGRTPEVSLDGVGLDRFRYL